MEGTDNSMSDLGTGASFINLRDNNEEIATFCSTVVTEGEIQQNNLELELLAAKPHRRPPHWIQKPQISQQRRPFWTQIVYSRYRN